MTRIENPSTKATGNSIVVIERDDPEVTASGTRESSLLMAALAAKASQSTWGKPRTGHPKRNKTRAKMQRLSKRRNRL